MSDEKPTHQERLKRALNSGGQSGNPPKEADAEEAEVSCGAFGYLRGIRDLPGSVEFRFRTGESVWFAYSLLGTWRYNPSEGLLLKFSGDMVYLVLIRGSNLDKPLNEGAINLTTGGLQRSRVVWIREMSKEDIQQVGNSGPTIDSIQVQEFESQAALKEWLTKNAPAFARVRSLLSPVSLPLNGASGSPAGTPGSFHVLGGPKGAAAPAQGLVECLVFRLKRIVSCKSVWTRFTTPIMSVFISSWLMRDTSFQGISRPFSVDSPSRREPVAQAVVTGVTPAWSSSRVTAPGRRQRP